MTTKDKFIKELSKAKKDDVIDVSSCCGGTVTEGYRDSMDHHNPVATCFCDSCGYECEVEQVKVLNDIEDIIAKDQVDLDLHNLNI